MTKDPILEIVESLSQGEKKSFSMLHGNAAAQGKEWLKLFREMNNPRGFNSAKAIKKFKNEKSYYNARFTLKKELDLFLTNRDSSPRKMLFNYSSLALEYIERKLFDHALDNINKGKEIAEKYEALDELGVLLKLEKSIPGRAQQKILLDEIKEFYRKRDQYEQLGILSRRLEAGIREVRSEELKISLVDAVLDDAKDIGLEELGTQKAAFEANVLFRKCHYLKDDLITAVSFSQKAIDCFQVNLKHLDQVSLEKLINEYSIQATLFSTLEDHDGFHIAISKIKFFPIKFSSLNLLKVRKMLLPYLVYALDYGNYEQGIKEYNRFKPILKEVKGSFISRDLIRIYFALAKLYFILGNAQKTVLSLNEFHSLKRYSPKIYSQIYPYAEIIGIADLIQREINEVALSRLNVLKRIIIREGLDYPYFRLLIKIFDHLIQYGRYFDESIIEDYSLELFSLQEKKSSKMHFGYFDPEPFLVSFLNNTPIKEAYQNKLKRNSLGLSGFG